MNVRYRIVGIGNSIVNGFPLKRSECFLSLIRQDTGHEVINKGANGETTEGIRSRFVKDLLFHCPDIGLVLTGTNDFVHQTATPQEALANLEWMVRKMEEEKIRPLLLTPIPVFPELASERWMAGAGVDYERVNRELLELSRLMKKTFPDQVLDLGGLFEEAVKNRPIEEISLDGIHPTAEGHRVIARILEKWLEEKGLQENG